MTITLNPHPGETLRDHVLPAPGLSVTKTAEQLNVSRAALSRILNGHKADLWIAQQAAYDLWNARKSGLPKVGRANITHALDNHIA